MVHKKSAVLVTLAVTGAALIAAPAPAASRGGGGGRAMHAAAFHGGGAFRAAGVGFARGPVVANRAFFARQRVFARRPFLGYGIAYAGFSCWRWVPTPVGPRQVWVCNYPYGTFY